MKDLKRIVDSMNPSEILGIFSQDAVFINHKIEELTKAYKKRLYPITSDIKILGSCEFKRKDGLNIVLIFFDKGNSLPTKERLGLFEYMWFHYRGGISAIKLMPDKKFGFLKIFYTAHFLKRYRERKLKENTISLIDALKSHVINNTSKTLKYLPSEKYPNDGWMPTRDGLAFIEVKPDSFIIMKTFIAWDQLSNVKKEISHDLIVQAINSGAKFEMPEELIDDSDINALDALN